MMQLKAINGIRQWITFWIKSYPTNRTSEKPTKGKRLGIIIVINVRLNGRLD